MVHRPARRREEKTSVFFLANHAWNRMACFLEAGKIPKIRKAPALLRFHWLNRTIVSIQEHAFTVGLFFEGQPTPIPGQPRKPLDELNLAHSLEGCEAGHFTVIQPHLAGPTAASRATLAGIEYWHERSLLPSFGRAKRQTAGKGEASGRLIVGSKKQGAPRSRSAPDTQ
jgi:hypothetical protein